MQYFNETDDSVNRKVHAAFEYNLTPIVCVGESLEERESGGTVDKVAGQVKKAFAKLQVKMQPKQSLLMNQFGQSEREKLLLRKMRMKYAEQFVRQSVNYTVRTSLVKSAFSTVAASNLTTLQNFFQWSISTVHLSAVQV